MQAPRNWRMKEQRYRLTSTENATGEKSIVGRPAPLVAAANAEDTTQHNDTTIIESNAA